MSEITDERWQVEIGKAESTMLGVEDHGMLTCMVYMDFGGSGQGAGGYMFDSLTKYTPFADYDDGSKKKEWSRVGSAYGMEFVRRLLLAFGVEKWEDIPGRTVFVLRAERFGPIKGIRPLPTEGGREFIFDDLQVLSLKEETA